MNFRAIPALALFCLLVSAAGASASAGVGAGGTAHRVSAPAHAGLDYWTDARMRAAVPAPLPERAATSSRGMSAAAEPDVGSPLSVAPSLPAEVRAAAAAESARGGTSIRANEVRRPTKFPNRTHGKAFFTIPGQGDFVCSASVVRSPSRSLVWTAGHCVYDRGFVRRWVFVPAYRNGKRPYGVWPARKLASTPQWKRSSALKYDLGAARVAKRGGGGDIQRRTGARGIAFNRDVPQRLDAFGYPAESNTQTNQDFDGQRPYRCDSRAKGRENPPGRGPKTIRIGCDMTAGASGGGWVNARGLVLSVSSYVRERGTNTELYGPYMGEIAKDLYQRMAKRG